MNVTGCRSLVDYELWGERGNFHIASVLVLAKVSGLSFIVTPRMLTFISFPRRGPYLFHVTCV